MALNVMSQLFGSKKGHAINSTFDNAVASTGISEEIIKLGETFASTAAANELKALGYTPDVDGVLTLIDAKIDHLIESTPLSAQAKIDIEALLEGLVTIIKSKVPNTSL